jgi:hypothetical protein
MKSSSFGLSNDTFFAFWVPLVIELEQALHQLAKSYNAIGYRHTPNAHAAQPLKILSMFYFAQHPMPHANGKSRLPIFAHGSPRHILCQILQTPSSTASNPGDPKQNKHRQLPIGQESTTLSLHKTVSAGAPFWKAPFSSHGPKNNRSISYG